tara:strand:+ start:11450 stop:12583 length:1134 start_codon:yes stop_codon:yes gene_type:complete
MPQVINGQALNNTEGFDRITSTDKITTGYFTGGVGKLVGNQFTTASLQATQENYYFGIAKDSVSGSLQFHVTYGNVNGYGADTDVGTVKSETEAIYKEWANILLAPTEVTGGFKISQQGSNGVKSSGTKDDEIFVLVGQRSLFKDRINKKNWTITLSGSRFSGQASPSSIKSGSQILHLTDDSATTAATSTPAGPRYNIVSGSDGTVVTASTARTFGWFYPDQGVMVFSQAELSASLPGSASQADSVVQFNKPSFMGFGTTTNVDQNYHQALRFVNCLDNNSGQNTFMKFRSEEDQTSVSYFCRARAAHYNFSNNPTFVSGSQNELRHTSMKGNPNTFITGVELYDSVGNMVATGKLSTPLKKNFSSEATIKVKLTF